MLERISLEDRLNRLEAGYASSPQVTRILADTFCRTPIVPALEECGSFYERERLCELLRDGALKAYYPAFDFDALRLKSIEDVTYGDIAFLIAEHYRRHGTASPRTIEKLLIIYFNCIESLVIEQKIPREHLKPCLQPIYDFLHMSFTEYYEYAKQCGLGKFAEKIDDFRLSRGLSSRMTPIRIFEELKLSLWNYDEAGFDFTQSSQATVEQSEHFIDFFVCPVAAIWNPPIIENT